MGTHNKRENNDSRTSVGANNKRESNDSRKQKMSGNKNLDYTDKQ